MKLTDAMLLRVNLTNRTTTEEPIDEALLKDYLGGRGLGTRYFTKEVDPGVDALSPDNKLIFACGLLTGSSAPTAGRYMVITKSPLTGTIACSNSGGVWGAVLRKTGYMMIILEGKSSKPVYLAVNDKKVEFNDASHIWGKKTGETTDILLEEFGEKQARVSCIGPAGENLSEIGCIINDKHRAPGRSGVGAVMGSKNLKAIVVKGSNTIDFKDKSAFTSTVKEKIDKIKQHPVTGEGLPALGTKVLDNIINQGGLYPTNNFQFGTFADVGEVSGEALVKKGYLKKNTACFACPIACARDVELPNGITMEGPEYETGWAFGAHCGVNDLHAICEANFLCNELGLDTISAGVTIGAAMEMYEKGLIPKEDLEDGPELKFGNSESVVYWTNKMGRGEGKLGKLMAKGSWRMGEAYGNTDYSMTVKKQELPAYDPRGVQGHGLQYATSNRGGCHVRGYMISPEVLGVPEKLDPQELKGKPQWVIIFQDLTAVIDSAGLCLFTSFALGLDDYADLINASSGFTMSPEEVLKIGSRIWSMERKFNMAAGIDPSQDTLPKRMFEPMPDGPQKGAVHQLSKMLPEYYELRGWSPDGTIPEKTLKELGLA
jgi:aldehyde:ferredoxin oxidoreductase